MELAMSGSGSGEMGLTNASMMEMMNITNSTASGPTCAGIQVKGLPLPLSPTTASVVRSLQIIYYITSFLLGLLLNGSLILIISCNKKLRNVTYCFALQIVIVDFAHALIIYPTSAVNAIVGGLAFTGLCSTLGLFVTFMRSSRNLLMAMLVVDRFSTVFSPFWYNRSRTKLVMATSLVAWVIPTIVALIPVSGLLDCYTFTRPTWACQLGVGCSHKVACTAYRTFITTSSLITLSMVFLLYIALLIKARKIRNKVATVSSESREVSEEAKRTRLRERRANTTFFILFLALTGSLFFPYLFFNFGNLALSALKLRPPPPAFTIIAIIARSSYVILIILDPIVIMRNPEVKEAIADVKTKIKEKLGCSNNAQETPN